MSPARSRSISLLGLVLGGSLTLAAWSQVWFIFAVALPGSSADSLSVSGQQVAPALSALALSVYAVVAALSLAQRFARVALALVAALLGCGIVVTTVFALANPAAASGAIFVKLTGNTSLASVTSLITSTDVSGFGVMALVGGVVVVCSGSFALATLRRWPSGSSRKFDTATVVTPSSDDSSAYRNVDSWDLLSRGTDPTIE
jgi:uncharacterized membrane protein (TIGR02234 family)